MPFSIFFLYFTSGFLFLASLFSNKILIFDALLYLFAAAVMHRRPRRAAMVFLAVMSFAQGLLGVVQILKSGVWNYGVLGPCIVFCIAIHFLSSLNSEKKKEKLQTRFLERNDQGFLDIDAYLNVLRTNTFSVLAISESELPCDRNTLRDQLIEVLRTSSLKNSRRVLLEAAYEMLSRFVSKSEAELICRAESLTMEWNSLISIDPQRFKAYRILEEFFSENASFLDAALARIQCQADEDRMILEEQLCLAAR